MTDAVRKNNYYFMKSDEKDLDIRNNSIIFVM